MASYPSIQPAQAPVQSSSAYHTPKPGPPYASAQTTPPSWQRKEEEDSGPPAWGNTLKATGIKPWDADVSYSNEQQPLSKPNIAATNESGERDWSQSAVLKFITQEDTKKGKQPPLPAVAPKPQFYPVQPSRSPQPFYQPVDASEF
uniref:Zasp-like motif domain-containing protein n=1 Tax=Arion vulgaris TaxID=1028688 RepID=A0A0B7BEN5_9EUPU